MSLALQPRPRLVPSKRSFSFAIVASQFNARYVQGLVNHAAEELREIAPHASIALHQVPGAFEIPVVVRELAKSERADAVLAMGVILKGSTSHADHLATSVTQALQQIAIDFGVPVIHAVLSLDDESQARERCLEEKINRGTEAARAAVQIVGVLSELRAKK